MAILVTGGTGFIGSHVVVNLLAGQSGKNETVVILDSLVNSGIHILDKIKKITDKGKLMFIKGDIRDADTLEQIFTTYKINTVMHFAALKSVSESEKYPELYHDVNVNGTINILSAMNRHGCTNFIYSSSATVYGENECPVNESSPVGEKLACQYAVNKFMMEKHLIENKEKLYKDWNIVVLRYFNPIGAHSSGLIGEDPYGIPNNVFPYLLRVAKWFNSDPNERDESSPYKIFTIFGNTYPTKDGTGIRDYVHVDDLARAHVEVLPFLNESDPRLRIYNVGTGIGTSVFELVTALNHVLSKRGKEQILFRYGENRQGDVDISYANADKIAKECNFRTKYNINDMCEHGLNFIGL